MDNYRIYTTPAELEKAIHTLQGMIAGTVADEVLNYKEAQELGNWCSLHANLREYHPFNEILPIVETALEDGVINSEGRTDILWLCERIARGQIEGAAYYNDISAAIQYLNGFAHGILADGILRDAEIAALQNWLDCADFLQGTYPFDELNSLVTSILRDGKIGEDERNTLIAFLGNLVEFKDSWNLSEEDFKSLREKYSVGGICALCPDIEFKEKRFVFTGDSYKATREELCALVKARGGISVSSVSTKTDYLIVGSAGNPCWAYSCYGRKIEKAMLLRREGAKVQIVHENDFWDAIQDS